MTLPAVSSSFISFENGEIDYSKINKENYNEILTNKIDNVIKEVNFSINECKEDVLCSARELELQMNQLDRRIEHLDRQIRPFTVVYQVGLRMIDKIALFFITIRVGLVGISVILKHFIGQYRHKIEDITHDKGSALKIGGCVAMIALAGVFFLCA